ncbi:MAG: hypothetical protein Q4A16_10020 [Lautropia sp.]|nr:hypothetical protein [Lautropia sp.]
MFLLPVASTTTAETCDLNHLTQAPNPHGTAIITSLTPIAACATGTALFVAIA